MERVFNGELIEEPRGLPFCAVCEGATWALTAHFLDISVHPRPVKPELNAVECTVDIEVSANRIGVECDEDNVAQTFWDDLQFDVSCFSVDVFFEYYHVFLNYQLRLSKGVAVHEVDFTQRVFQDPARVKYELFQKSRLFVDFVFALPRVRSRHFGADRSIQK